MRATFFGSPNAQAPQALADWFSQNNAWVNSMVQRHASTDRYWNHIGLIVQQFQGLVAGYQSAAQTGQELQQIDFSVRCKWERSVTLCLVFALVC
jgi:hypothetical protein